jgi:hypothetical protein
MRHFSYGMAESIIVSAFSYLTAMKMGDLDP